MSRVAIFTFTRDRLDFTRRCFESMRVMRPGARYDHFVFDNGSTDGTGLWLKAQKDSGRITDYILCGENMGLSHSFNRAYGQARDGNYDYVMTVDNDALFKTRHWLRKLIRAQKTLGVKNPKAVVSPTVDNLMHPPQPYAVANIDKMRFGFVDILGGIARFMPVAATEGLELNARLPLAWGQDQSVASHCANANIPMAYVYNIVVRHMMTDAEQFDNIPEYMRRKNFEAYIPYGL